MSEADQEALGQWEKVSHPNTLTALYRLNRPVARRLMPEVTFHLSLVHALHHPKVFNLSLIENRL